MNRGRNRALIFMDGDDALDFLNIIGDTEVVPTMYKAMGCSSCVINLATCAAN